MGKYSGESAAYIYSHYYSDVSNKIQMENNSFQNILFGSGRQHFLVLSDLGKKTWKCLKVLFSYRVMRVAVPIPAVASASVFHSAAGGSVVDVVRPL